MDAMKAFATSLGAVAFAAAVSATPARADMVSYWTFEERQGSEVNDAVGNNRGQVNGATWTDGIVGGGLSFDGPSTNVTVPDSEGLRVVGNRMTVEAWIRPAFTIDGAVGGASILVRKGSSSDGWDIEILGNAWGHGLHFAARTNAGWYYFIGQPRTWQAHKWYHVAGTYDGSAFAGFVDGVPEPAVVAHSTSANLAIGTTPLMFAQNPIEASSPFYGTMDEIAVYNHALSGDDIAQHFQDGLAGRHYATPPTRPVAVASVDLDVDGILTLYGNASYDPLGSIASWKWTLTPLTGGNPVLLPGEVVPLLGVAHGHYAVTLTVTDLDGVQATSDPFEVVVPFMGDPQCAAERDAEHAARLAAEAESTRLAAALKAAQADLAQGQAGLVEIDRLLKTKKHRRASDSTYTGVLGDLLNEIIDRLLPKPKHHAHPYDD